MKKVLIFSAIALTMALVGSGGYTAEATPVEKVKVVKQSLNSIGSIEFRNFDLAMPVEVSHDYSATYTHPRPTGVVVSQEAPITLVEARCNSPGLGCH